MTRRPAFTHYPRTILWLVPGGRAVIRGSDADGGPSFEIEVEPFYLGKWPITNEQFEAFDSVYERSPLSPGDRDIAVGISWEEATAYCQWYAEISRKPMRLPSEIEWEYACRAGAIGDGFFREEEADLYAWHLGNSGGCVRPAEEKRANDFGLHGMLGSVWEWTASPGEERKVLRGGSFRTPVGELSCSCRRAEAPCFRADDVGFRVAKSFR